MKKIILSCLFLLVSHTVPADILIEQGFKISDVSQSLSVYAPSEVTGFNEDTIDDLFSNNELFTKNTHQALQLGDAKQGYWVKGRISVTDDAPKNLVLRLDYSHIANARLYIKQKGVVDGQGKGVLNRPKQLTDCVLAFGFAMQQSDVEFLLYVQPQGVPHNIYNVHAYLYDLASYDRSKFTQLAFFCIMFGFLCAMFAYNLVLYLYVGYKPYFYYCGYLAAMFVLNYVGTGFGNIGIIPLSTSTSVLLYSVMPSIVIIALIQFGRAILELKLHLPRMDRFFKHISLLWALCIPMIILDWSPSSSGLIYLQLSSIAMLAMTAYWVHKHKQLAGALIFSLSFIFILLGAVFQLSLEVVSYEKHIDSAAIIGWFKWSEHYIFHIFIMIEMMFLSIALAAFIRKAEDDKQLAQAEKIELLGQALILKEQYSSQLELEVEQRAGEIKQKNVELYNLQELRDRFFSYISHEFRSPLTLALGPLSEISDGKYGELSQPLTSAVQLAERNARKMLNLVNLMLDLARQKNDKMYLSIKTINVSQSIEKLLQDYALLMAEKSLAVTVNNKVMGVYHLWFDHYYFDSIFSNLLSNACKYTPLKGRIEINYQIENDSFIVKIFNSGSFIGQNQQRRIFERFYKGNGSELKDDNSSGIGLAMVKEFLSTHKGEISVCNTENGVCFTVKLKLGKQHLEAESWLGHDFDFITSTDRDELADKSGLSVRGESEDKTKILLADDNQELLDYLSQTLLDEGYQVITATDGEKAYAACQTQMPDIIVSDVVMPVVSGLELVNLIRQNEEIKHTPIILLTSEVDKNLQIEGIEKGADDYLTKPFVPKELLARIQRIHQQRQVLREKVLQENRSELIDVTTTSDKKDIKIKALQIIQENLANSSFGVEQLAELLYVNRSTLHRQLKDKHNIAANELILDARLTVALKLLATETLLIDIAYSVGFNSQSYFAKKFKEKYGMTPSVWRKSQV